MTAAAKRKRRTMRERFEWWWDCFGYFLTGGYDIAWRAYLAGYRAAQRTQRRRRTDA